jgi:hypothetical protein
MRVAEAQRIARDEKGRKAVKEDKLKLLLQQPELASAGGSVPMPLDPSIQVCFYACRHCDQTVITYISYLVCKLHQDCGSCMI